MTRENISPEQKTILRRKGIISFRNNIFASLYSNGRVVVSSNSGKKNLSPDFSQTEEWKNIRYISCGTTYLCAVDADGNLLISGSPAFNISQIPQIKNAFSVECSLSHFTVLDTEGHVKCIGNNLYGECNTEKWNEIVDICCGDNITAALRSDGTVLCAGKNAAKLEAAMNKYNLLSIYSSAKGDMLFGIINGGSIMSTSSGKPEFLKKNIVHINTGTSPVSVITEDGELIYRKTSLNSKHSAEHICLCAGDEQNLYYVTKDGFVHMLSGKKLNTSFAGNRIYESFDNLDTERENKKASQELLEISMETAAAVSNKLKDLVRCGEHMTICVSANEKIHSTMYSKNTEKASGVISAECGLNHLLFLLANGTVKAYGSNKNGCCNTDSWRGVTSVCAGTDISLGLRTDGSVLLAGRSSYINTAPVLKWKNIVRIKCETEYIAALDSGGNLLVCGNPPFDRDKISDIKNISDFCISPTNIVLYLSDKSIAVLGSDKFGECGVSAHKNIRQIVCSENYIAALGFNGKIYAAGDNSFGQCEVAQFTDIVSISCGKNHIAALDTNGNVFAAGANGFGQCDVNRWKNIAAVYCGKNHTVGLDKNGFLHACGQNANNQCDVSQFRLFDSIEDYDRERNEVIGKRLVSSSMDKKDFSDESLAVYNTGVKLPTDPEEHRTPSSLLQNIRSDCLRYQDKAAFDSNGAYAICALEGFSICGNKSSHENKDIVSLCSANGFILRIDIQGKLSCVGRSFDGIDKLENITCVKSGKNHISALSKNGKVFSISCSDNTPPATDSWVNISQIACGSTFTLGLNFDGKVLTAISTNGDTGMDDIPVSEISDLSKIEKIFAFKNTVVAVDFHGKPHIFGNTYESKSKIEELSVIVDVAFSNSHIVLLASDGTVYSFGSNENGECNTQKWHNAVAISATDGKTAAVRADGKLLFVGKSQELYANIYNVNSVFIDEKTVLILSNTGELHVISDKDMIKSGLHLFTPGPDCNTVLRLYGRDVPFYISSRILSSHMAISNTEKLYIDNGNTLYVYNRSSVNTYFHSRDNVALADCGNNHSAYIKNKVLYLNGDNSYGQCELDKSENAAYAACGTYTTALIYTNGDVKMCGLNNYGQCDTKDISRASMAACGTYHTAILTADGKAVCVGNNEYGQCNTSGWENIVYIACGDYHTVGLTADGHAVCTGDNRCLQLIPKDISNIACIACTPYSTLCLMFDGTLLPFGFSADLEEKLLKKTSCAAIKCRENKIFITYTDGHIEII